MGHGPHHSDSEIQMASQEQISQVSKVLSSSTKIFCSHFGVQVREPFVKYDLAGTTAGQAIASHWAIRINQKMMDREGSDFITDLVIHEVSHLFSWYLTRQSGHGPHWQMVVRVLGGVPQRCHNYDVQGLQTGGTYVYRCPVCGRSYNFSKRRHNNVSLRGKSYRCNDHIHSILSFTGQIISGE